MASRMKEDERNEKIIRGLLKLPANRRCINCNNLGPQYVCTNFWTFICTNCSGLHREFCHRVKSVSMAKFTTQEVVALQERGNEKAKEIYFKEWDLQRHSLPDSNNTEKLRDFIKHVYVDRRFTGERNADRPPQGKANWNDSNDSRKGDSYRGDSRSPQYEDRYSEPRGSGARNGDRKIKYIYGERSPGFDRADNKRSPHRFESGDDRIQDDRYGIPRFEDRKPPDAAAKLEGSSPSHEKDVLSFPVVRSVRDILGDDVPQLRVDDASRPSSSGFTDSSAATQRTSSTSSMGSTDWNSVQLKRVNSGSLIDFTVDPPPPAAPQQHTSPENTSLPSNDGDWASFDNVGQEKVSPAASNAGTVEFALSQLSTQGPATTSQVATSPTSGITASARTNDMGQWPQVEQQHQTSLFPANRSQPVNPPFRSTVPVDQAWGLSTVSSSQAPLSNSGGQLPQAASRPPQQTSIGVSTQSTSAEAKPTGRKELPADLFAALYPSAPSPLAGWQQGPHPGIGYGTQYPMGMPQLQPMTQFPHPSKSLNPFDVGSEPALIHSPTFPSMASLQGALPQVPGPSPLLQSSSFGNPPPHWVSLQQSSFPPAAYQGPYMVQQIPGSMAQPPNNNVVMMGHQATGGPGNPAAPFSNFGMDQFQPGRYPLPNASNSFGSTGGNPFG